MLLGAEATGSFVGPVALAVAVLSTRPASTSAWVIVYVAVQTVVAPGASVVARQEAPAASRLSTMPTAVTVTEPAFLTAKV